MDDQSRSIPGLGERVLIEDHDLGTVVFSTISGQFSEKFTKAEWGDMRPGVMIKTDVGALVFYEAEYFESDNCKVEIIGAK